MDLSNSSAACFQCSDGFSHTYASIFICLSLLSLPLKFWAMWLMTSDINFKMDLLTLNLFCNDILLNFLILFLMINMVSFHQLSVYLWSFLLCLVAFGRPLFLCFICVERYVAVNHPVLFLKYRPLRYRAALLSSAWISVLMIWFLSVGLCEFQIDHISQFLYFQCSLLLLIFLINSFCSVAILRVLIRPSPGEGKRERVGRGGRVRAGKESNSVNNQIKQKAFNMVAGLQLYLMTCYLPPIAMIFSHSVMKVSFCAAYMMNLCSVTVTSLIFGLHRLHTVGKLKWMDYVGTKLIFCFKQIQKKPLLVHSQPKTEGPASSNL